MKGEKQCPCSDFGRAEPRGFHNVTLVDNTGDAAPPVLRTELGLLRKQWPTSLLVGMSRR